MPQDVEPRIPFSARLTPVENDELEALRRFIGEREGRTPTRSDMLRRAMQLLIHAEADNGYAAVK